MGNKDKDLKPIEDVCCGSYCEDAGCCPFDYYPEPKGKERDRDTKDMFPNERRKSRNPDLGN